MPRIDHTRPILKIIDNLRRGRVSDPSKPKLHAKVSITKLTRPNSAREMVHQRALKIIEHVGQHGDVRLAIKFLEELREKHVHDAVKRWLCNFGRISSSEELVLRFDRTKRTRIADGMKKPYWKLARRMS